MVSASTLVTPLHYGTAVVSCDVQTQLLLVAGPSLTKVPMSPSFKPKSITDTPGTKSVSSLTSVRVTRSVPFRIEEADGGWGVYNEKRPAVGRSVCLCQCPARLSLLESQDFHSFNTNRKNSGILSDFDYLVAHVLPILSREVNLPLLFPQYGHSNMNANATSSHKSQGFLNVSATD